VVFIFKLVKKKLANSLSKLRRLYADDVQYVDPRWRGGSEAAIGRLRSQEEPLSNMSFRIESLVADERSAVVEWVLTATNSGPMTIPDGATVPASKQNGDGSDHDDLRYERRADRLRAELLGQPRTLYGARTALQIIGYNGRAVA
jgi:hypothetical protein